MLCHKTGHTLPIQKVGRVDFFLSCKKETFSEPATAEYTERRYVNQKLATER